MDLSHPWSQAHRGFTSLLSALSGVGVLWASPDTLPGASQLLPWSPALPEHFLWRLHLPALAWLLFSASGVRLFALSHLGLHMFFCVFIYLFICWTQQHAIHCSLNAMSMVSKNKMSIDSETWIVLLKYWLGGLLVDFCPVCVRMQMHLRRSWMYSA